MTQMEESIPYIGIANLGKPHILENSGNLERLGIVAPQAVPLGSTTAYFHIINWNLWFGKWGKTHMI